MNSKLEFSIPQPDLSLPNTNIVLIGHVDHGKSTLAGRILLDSGMLDPRIVEKWRQEAIQKGRETWYLSWALDLTALEREKGKTTQVGKAFFQTSKRRFTVLDAPGHRGYIPAMIEGASQADVGLLVVSCRKNEFEAGFSRGGQTREHAMLARTAGIAKLIVVVNKMDDPVLNWSEARYLQIRKELKKYLKTCGYHVKGPSKAVFFVPVDGYLGQNIGKKVDPEVCSWYQGPTLFDLLESVEPEKPDATAPVRFSVVSKYKTRGLCLNGKIETGTITKGQKLVLVPGEVKTEVVGIEFESENVDSCPAGESVELLVKGPSSHEVYPGAVLCDPNDLLYPISKFEAQMLILRVKNVLLPGKKAMIHIGNTKTLAKIVELVSVFDRKAGKMIKNADFARSGDTVTCKIRLQEPVILDTFQNFAPLGRFMMREDATTISVGKILKVYKKRPNLTTSTSSSN